jgi:mannose-6-phosphate isomerase-like protein (cupin superfamily)
VTHNTPEYITCRNKIIAIILYSSFKAEGVHFFTPDELSQQLAYINHPPGKMIETHIHNLVQREVQYTQEVLFIKKGKIRVDIYDDQQNYLISKILEAGDVLFLAAGGHGFEVIEEIEMIEVKQGPYAGELDKKPFKGIDLAKLVIEGKKNE